MKQKECNVCNKNFEANADNFQKRISYRDGLDVACKPCRSEKHREYMRNYKINGAKKPHTEKPEKLYITYGNEIYL